MCGEPSGRILARSIDEKCVLTRTHDDDDDVCNAHLDCFHSENVWVLLSRSIGTDIRYCCSRRGEQHG